MRKLEPNESGSLERFAFVRWYVDEEVFMGSVEEAECLVGWGCKSMLIYIQLLGSFNEEGMVAGKYIFEGGLNFSASESRKKFDSTASEDWGVIGEI